MDFNLWLETEHVGGDIDDFCNVLVTLASGEKYALSVWTFAFFDVARNRGEDLASPALARSYMLPPDLFVTDLSRATLQPVVGELLDRGLMPADCLVTDDDRPPEQYER